MYLIDTNILLRYPSVLNEYKSEIIIPIRVLEEIDRLKQSPNSELAYQARRASHKIFLRIDNIEFSLMRDDSKSVDDDIIEIAKEKGAILISNDLNVGIKCKAAGVEWRPYDKVETDYTGVRYKDLPLDEYGYNEELEDILENRTTTSLKNNEFLIIKDKETGKHVVTVKKTNGQIEIIENHFFYNNFCGKILPRNLEQNCLMDLLEDSNISILAAIGSYGTGKSYLLTNYALKELERGNISKIVYVPNNSIVENARDLGTLPGDVVEKEFCYMGPMIDLVGMDYTKHLIAEEQLEIVPMSIIRGRNFTNAIIIVNEAQNLTTEHVKLLIARCGERSRIFFDGDIKQSDSSIFKNKSGLKLLLHLSDSEEFSDIFGAVKLCSIERSKTAQASAYLADLLV